MARRDHHSFRKLLLSVLALAAFLGVGHGSARAQATISVTSVKRVVTADTIVTADGRSVRLIGIVAPESGEAAEQARKVTESLVLGKNVELWYEGQNGSQRHQDAYGRSLCYVYILPARKLLNVEVIRNGGAYAYSTHYIDVPTRNGLLGAEYQARRAKLGVWAQGTESPEEIAKRQGKTYTEPPFTLPPDPTEPEKPANRPSAPTSEPTRPEGDPATSNVPQLDPRQAYGGVRVEGCGLLEVAPLGRLALIGVQNIPGKNGEVPRVEVSRLLQGRKLRFSLDSVNATRGHRDKDGNLLVYATLPDGSLLNLQIVTRGIADVDIDYDFQFKMPMLTARDNARAKQAGPRWGASGTTLAIAQTVDVILKSIQTRFPQARLTSDKTILILINDPDFNRGSDEAWFFVKDFRRALLLNGVEKVIFQSTHNGHKYTMGTGGN